MKLKHSPRVTGGRMPGHIHVLGRRILHVTSHSLKGGMIAFGTARSVPADPSPRRGIHNKKNRPDRFDTRMDSTQWMMRHQVIRIWNCDWNEEIHSSSAVRRTIDQINQSNVSFAACSLVLLPVLLLPALHCSALVLLTLLLRAKRSLQLLFSVCSMDCALPQFAAL
jgi:hypothetical protein